METLFAFLLDFPLMKTVIRINALCITYLPINSKTYIYIATNITFDRQTMFNRFTPSLFFLNQQRQIRSGRHNAGQFGLELHPLGIKLICH